MRYASFLAGIFPLVLFSTSLAWHGFHEKNFRRHSYITTSEVSWHVQFFLWTTSSLITLCDNFVWIPLSIINLSYNKVWHFCMDTDITNHLILQQIVKFCMDTSIFNHFFLQQSVTILYGHRHRSAANLYGHRYP